MTFNESVSTTTATNSIPERQVILLRNIPIKFRAVASENFAGVKQGDTVYGGINAFANEIIDVDGIAYEVDPATVAQFAGYDSTGMQVWDGDWLLDNDGACFIANVTAIASNGSNAANINSLRKI